MLAAAGAHLYILSLRGSGRFRQCRASRHRHSRAGGYAYPRCPQRYGTGQWLERQLRQSGAAGQRRWTWPTTTEQQKLKIEQTAQATLDARALYPDSSLADLYDELTMSPEQRKAHQANDRAVMDAYGFVKGSPARTSESACVAELMKMYQTLTSK